MSGPDQLLGVRSGLALEPARKAVGIGLERTALGRDRALAVLDAAFPNSRSCRLHARSLLGCCCRSPGQWLSLGDAEVGANRLITGTGCLPALRYVPQMRETDQERRLQCPAFCAWGM